MLDIFESMRKDVTKAGERLIPSKTGFKNVWLRSDLEA